MIHEKMKVFRTTWAVVRDFRTEKKDRDHKKHPIPQKRPAADSIH